MSDSSSQQRFEELEAGRILGDLDAQEIQEWKALAASLKAGPDLELELVAAAIESEFLASRGDALPDHLASRLRTGTRAFVSPPASANVLRPDRWRSVLASSSTAWSVAAVLAILLVATVLVNFRNRPGPPRTTRYAGPISGPTELQTVEARDLLERDAPDLLKIPIAGLPGFEGVRGELIWSDVRQRGFMTIASMPANTPSRNQYQLWIVDPSRDDEPVDGGVFDIFPGSGAQALIPIRTPPVAVSKPAAFLITLEKPGGVVVSDRTVEVALASRS